MTTGGKYPTVVTPAAWETLCVLLQDVRAWADELAACAPHDCRAEAQLHDMVATQLLPALEASQEERSAGFAAAQARERERDAARQAALRERALQVRPCASMLDGPLTRAAASACTRAARAGRRAVAVRGPLRAAAAASPRAVVCTGSRWLPHVMREGASCSRLRPSSLLVRRSSASCRFVRRKCHIARPSTNRVASDITVRCSESSPAASGHAAGSEHGYCAAALRSRQPGGVRRGCGSRQGAPGRHHRRAGAAKACGDGGGARRAVQPEQDVSARRQGRF